MQKFTQKWTVVSLLEPVQDNTKFSYSEWPRHITVADIFTIGLAGDKLLKILRPIIEQQRSIELTTANVRNFGPVEKPVKVITFQPSDSLQSLHNSLIGTLDDFGAVFDNPEFTRRGFIAHSALGLVPHLHTAEVVQISSLSIIDMLPDNDGLSRRVLKTLHFAHT